MMPLLIQGDARRIPLKDESVDMVLTSPPYGQLRDYEGYEFEFEPIANEIARVLKYGGVIVWVVGDATDQHGESGESFRQALYFKSIGLRLHDTMIYMKSGPSYPSQNRYYQIFEYMFVFSKGSPTVFNPLKDRENRWFGQKWSKIRTRRERNGDLKSQVWYADEGEKLGTRFNIWQYQVGYGYHGDDYCHKHPASFPEQLAQDHIESWSKPGMLILDPMCGSGTTCKMAKITNRDYIGIDCSEKYTRLSQQRLNATQRGFAELFTITEGMSND
jgi:site-specific DNA-methyltransferase (adenine-specific)